MTKKLHRFVLLITGLFILFTTSCKKAIVEPVQENLLEQYFEQNILNSDFIVTLATDNGTDLTTSYTGYKFRLLKNTLYDGPMTGIKGGVTYNGTWSSNSDYSQLVISLTSPSVPSEFVFLNRSWRFTRKAIPVMELAPWGTTDPKILHMERQ